MLWASCLFLIFFVYNLYHLKERKDNICSLSFDKNIHSFFVTAYFKLYPLTTSNVIAYSSTWEFVVQKNVETKS